jgi:hypothetical protein
MYVGILYDLAKAFDFMNYDILMSKLIVYRVKDKAGQWFKSSWSNFSYSQAKSSFYIGPKGQDPFLALSLKNNGQFYISLRVLVEKLRSIIVYAQI